MIKTIQDEENLKMAFKQIDLFNCSIRELIDVFTAKVRHLKIQEVIKENKPEEF